MLEWMKINRWSVTRLAEEVGMSPVYLGSILNGHRRPSYCLAKRLSEFTQGKVAVEQLLDMGPKQERCPSCGKLCVRKKRKKDETEK